MRPASTFFIIQLLNSRGEGRGDAEAAGDPGLPVGAAGQKVVFITHIIGSRRKAGAGLK